MFEYAKLAVASIFPRCSSIRTLKRILRENAGTAFGCTHQFEAILKENSGNKLYQKYINNIAFTNYEDISTYITDIQNGKSNILFPGRPAMYATTSGTTNEPKFIPVSEEYIQKVYKPMDFLWVADIILKRPLVLFGKVFAVSSQAIESYAPDGVPVGSVSGLLKDRMSHFVSKRYAIPSCVYAIKDYQARYYALALLAILKDVTTCMTANPSTYMELIKVAQDHFGDIILDIKNGTVSCANLEPEIAEQISFKPNPKRARKLKKLYEKYGSGILPKHYWPHVQLVGAWRCGNAAYFHEKIRSAFPAGARFQDCGYFATECRLGLALHDNVNSVVFPHLNFYEFVKESELDSPNKHFLLINELQKGERYCPFVTTLSGLYRYNMNDIVEAGPRYFRTPTLKMVQKTSGIVSITGEKLYETQFISAVNSLGLNVNGFVGFANVADQRYEFYFEFANVPGNLEEAAAKIDSELQKDNIEYKAKRESLRLGMPVVKAIAPGSFEDYKKALLNEGRRDGQFKMVLLTQDEQAREFFRSKAL